MATPKLRPKNLKKDFDESVLRAEELSKKNKSTSEEFGNLELRSDLDEHISWNALSRLGYDPDRMQLLDAGEGYREATAQAAYAPSRMTKKGLYETFINFDNYEDLSPDDVIVTPNVSVPRVIAHEFSHRGLDLIRELYNEDPKFFKNVYGKDAANIMETIDEEGVEEELVELFDDPSDDYKKDLYGRFIPTTGAYGTVTDSTDEIDKNLYLDIDRPYVQDKLKGSSAKDLGYFTKARMQRLIPGHVGILQAAEDLLEAKGEPPIARQKNFLQKIMGFAIGGLATEEAPRSNSMSRQMEMALTGGSNDVDPVSGNEVPPGSLPEEVRDDIDARLSEGEYVVPADVVRYFGVKVFEDMRNEAKMGLSQMDADGRIGGEPVPATPTEGGMEGMQDITEEDLVALEQAMATGVADGGLMDKLATVAKSDKLINARMNAKGMSVGYAEGGAVQAPLNTDPTRVDALIDKFMIAAQNSPALMQELASRGVTLNTTGANMNPQEMQSANSQTERAFNTGGALGFTPSNYGLGFSVFGGGSGAGSSPVQEIETIMVEYYNPTTGDTMMIAHDKATNQPTQVVPAGYIIKPAGTGTPVTPVDPVKPENRDDDTRSASQKLLEESMKDTKWMERYDYSSPEGLYQTTKQAMEAELEAQHGIVQFISKFDKTGIMAKRPQLMILGQTNAHIRMLEKQGNTSAEEIKELKDLAAQYKEQHGLGGPLMGLVSNGWGLTDVINDTLGDDLFANTASSRTSVGTSFDPVGSTEAQRTLSSDRDRTVSKAESARISDTVAAMRNKSGKATVDASRSRTDASGKRAGDVGYESALAKRARLARESSSSPTRNTSSRNTSSNNNNSSNNNSSKYSAGRGRTGNSKTDWSKSGKYNKGGLMKKKKK
jgi:hypothetical protein